MIIRKILLQTFVRKSAELVHLTINGEVIKTTPEHPFYVKGQGFVNACELKIRDELLDTEQNVLIVEDTYFEICDEPITVYNFEVEDFHTYHVGYNSILVHNADYSQAPMTGADWYKYFRETYGSSNVKWKIHSVDDIIQNPHILSNYTVSEINSFLGNSWSQGTYGSNGLGWKFTQGDTSIFYHAGGGVHGGSYYGISSGKTGRIKIVNPETYIPLPGDKATIIFD